MSELKSNCRNCPAFPSSSFAGVDEEMITKIEGLGTRVKLKAGEEFRFERDGVAGCGCVHGGHLKIQHELRGQERTVRIASPGDLIGFRNWFSSNEYSARAIEAGEVCFFKNEDFEELRKSHVISENIIKALCETLRSSDQHVASLEAFPLRSRVASTLLGLYHKMGRNPYLLIDRVTISEMAGTVPESLARILTEFENENMIERQGRILYLKNLAALESAAAD